MRKVLLRFEHGLGDAVQLTSVLQHLKKYRTDWELYLLAKRGKHSVGFGHCAKVWHDQEPGPSLDFFDEVIDLYWYENYNAYGDVPNTKVTNCLREVFGIQPDWDLLNYKVHVGQEAMDVTRRYLESIKAVPVEGGRFNVVAIHYQGNTSQEKKDLSHETIGALCSTILEVGYVPLILDWDCRSPHIDHRLIHNPGVHAHDIWGAFGSGDAERITAMIQQCALFVGIDSGPQKCAGATDTPSIGVWTKHLPVQFMDLCPNFLHLVPDDFHTIPPCHHRQVASFFVNNYRFKTYPSERLFDVLCDEVVNMLNTSRPMRGNMSYVSGFWCPSHRPEQSRVIVEDVYIKDAYKTYLMPVKNEVEYVVDLGANIGCFSRLWHERNPEAKIVAVEVCDDLIESLKANVGEFAAVEHAACHYDEDIRLLSSFAVEGKSTGGSRIVSQADYDAETDPQYVHSTQAIRRMTLEDVAATHGFPYIDVLKLDVEGSEYSILSNCDLSKIGMIFIESHGAESWRRLMAEKFPPARWRIGHMCQSKDGNFEIWHLANKYPPGS